MEELLFYCMHINITKKRITYVNGSSVWRCSTYISTKCPGSVTVKVCLFPLACFALLLIFPIHIQLYYAT